MRIGPLIITRRRGALIIAKQGADLITHFPSLTSWPTIRESFAGAWQRGLMPPVEDALSNPTYFACVTLIASDVAKIRPMLVEENERTGITEEIENPAYSPVLTKPNHYQDRIQFFMYWILSKLSRGNAYALKERDGRGVVRALYLLDPTRVRPMVAPNGDVFYACGQDVLSGVDEQSVVVPAREIIHDSMYTLYHPLCGLSPIYASGQAAVQSLKLATNATKFAENGSMVGALLVAPGQISEQSAKRLEDYWNANYTGPQNAGKIAVIGDGMSFQAPSNVMSAVDSQMIQQLKLNDEKICATFHVPPYMVGVGGMPNYNNIEALNQQYYSQCLQILFESLELKLEAGLGLSSPYGVEFDVERGLLRMDSATKMRVATDGVKGSVFSPNEGRQMFNLSPVSGGDSPLSQQQNYSLEALARRDAAPPTPTPKPVPAPPLPRALDIDKPLLWSTVMTAVSEEEAA